MATWNQIDEVLGKFGGWLCEGGTPQRAREGPPLTVADEVRADRWLREWIANPHLDLPDPALRRALVPRFRYALLEAKIYLMTGKVARAEAAVDSAAEFERLLIREWYSQYREMWLDEPVIPGE
ncbi:MAG: hypothetical protein KIT22_19570 [Verrucomicrobiae bacterium]|nr:hypothetical protein [Verrucomicrobiae bacterium]